jgi:hypothetical protein
MLRNAIANQHTREEPVPMRTVSYGRESFTTSDDAAQALLEFAAVAAMNDVAEVVEVPSIRADGSITVARLVIGPASELITFEVDSPYDEPDTVEAAQRLRDRAAGFGTPRRFAHGEPFPTRDDDFDLN